MIYVMNYKMLHLWFLIFNLLTLSAFPYSPKKLSGEEELLLQYKNEIKEAAKLVDVSPRIIASIIYAEHKLNVKLGENVIDYVFAKSGYNSSMGIAQVKISTAIWIEKQIHNLDSQFYLGEEIEKQIPLSANWDEVIKKLEDPKANIIYAASYISMINRLWQPVFELSALNNINVGIIASIYSLGILDNTNKIRIPHTDAKMNVFGNTAQEFFQSFELRNDFK